MVWDPAPGIGGRMQLMPESIEDYANETRNLVENFDSSGFFGTWQGMALIAAVVLLILIWIFRRVSKARRRRKPVVLHPLLPEVRR